MYLFVGSEDGAYFVRRLGVRGVDFEGVKF